jgi:hypothetical protein
MSNPYLARFEGDVCRTCGGKFDWGGDERKIEHAAWHAEQEEALTGRRLNIPPRRVQTLTELDAALAERQQESASSLSVDDLFRHAMVFGPEEVYEVARVWLSPAERITLASRVNQVIAAASKPKRNGEPRAVTSYRARIAEARTHGKHPAYLAPMDTTEAGVDPRVQLTLDLRAQGEKTTVIAGRVGRSERWVRKTVRDAQAATAPEAGSR